MTTTDLPAPINQTATEIDKIIQTMENVLVPIAQKAIETAVPTLDIIVIKQITEAIEQGLANYITKYAQLGATFIVIDLQKDSEVSAASGPLAAVIAAEKSGDPNALAQAIAAFQKAQSALVKDDGSAKPTA